MAEPKLTAVKYEVIVRDDGSISVIVPFSPGRRVSVFVVEEQDTVESFDDLALAAQSSTAFWDNAFDDEDWNNA